MSKENYEINLGIDDKFDAEKINEFIEAVRENFDYEDSRGGRLTLSKTQDTIENELKELYEKAKEFVGEDFADNIKLGTKTLKETLTK